MIACAHEKTARQFRIANTQDSEPRIAGPPQAGVPLDLDPLGPQPLGRAVVGLDPVGIADSDA